MSVLAWIVLGGVAMSAIALVGALALLFGERTLKRLLLPLVGLGAGSLLGGALFHLIPAGVEQMGNRVGVYLWVAAGFSTFLLLEQFLHWHHCHRPPAEHRRPLTYLILVADTLHNFIGGLAVGGTFLVDVRLGIATWLAAAAHEVPQELGDFGVLVHGGWTPGRALAFNLLSASTFLVGGVVAWAVSSTIDVAFLLPFAAGNFLYISAVDLVPEIKVHESWRSNLLHFASFAVGLALLVLVRVLLEP